MSTLAEFVSSQVMSP